MPTRGNENILRWGTNPVLTQKDVYWVPMHWVLMHSLVMHKASMHSKIWRTSNIPCTYRLHYVAE